MALYDDYTNAGVSAGLSPDLAAYMPRFVQIESGGNPNARTGSYSGLLQMGPSEMRQYGGNGLDAGARMYADRANWFTNKFGRAPTPTELYMTNQQGMGGVAAHMANPDAPAWQNMLSTGEGQQKGAGWARQAIWGNVPDSYKKQFGSVDNITSQQFMDMWKHKVEGTPMPAMSGASTDQASIPSNARPVMYSPNNNGQGGGILSQMLGTNRPPNEGLLTSAFGLGSNGSRIGSTLQNMGAWALAANNPSGAAGLLNSVMAKQMMGKPTWGVVGKDIFGNETYGWINPMTGVAGQYTGPGNGFAPEGQAFANGSGQKLPGTAGAYGGSGTGQLTSASDLTNVLRQIQTARQNGTTDPAELMKIVPLEIRSDVDNVANYKQLPMNYGRSSQFKNVIDTLAQAVNPDFDATKLQGAIDYRKGLTSDSLMKPGGQKLALNTGFEHLNTLSSAIVNQGNSSGGGFAPAAYLTNLVGDNIQNKDKSNVTAVEQAADRYSGEMGKLYSGTQGGGVAEREQAKGRYSPYQAPEQSAAALLTDLQLMQGRHGALESQKSDSMPGAQANDINIMTPQARQNIAQIKANIIKLDPTRAAAVNSIYPDIPPAGIKVAKPTTGTSSGNRPSLDSIFK